MTGPYETGAAQVVTIPNSVQTRSARSERRVNGIDRWIVRLALLVLYCDVFSGALRFLFSSLKLIPLIYLPSVSIFLLIAFALVDALKYRDGYLVFGLTVFGILFLWVIAGLAGRSLMEIAFATYTWAPLFLGILIFAWRKEDEVFRHFPYIWTIAVVGVLVNKFVPFPWSGASYQVLGYNVDSAREWHAFSTMQVIERLPGFSRANFAVANQILVTSAILFVRLSDIRFKAVIYAMSVYAIYLTTSKSPLAIELLLPLAIFGYYTAVDHSIGTAYVRSSIALLLLAIIAPPLIQNFGRGFVVSSEASFLNFSSFWDRVSVTWPLAFELIKLDQSSWEWVFGRGLGGIGSAQYLLSPSTANSADNLFVFLYVTFGLLSVALVYCLFKGISYWCTANVKVSRDLYVLAVASLGIGITTTTIESVFPCVAMGLLMAKGFVQTTKLRPAKAHSRNF